MNLYIIFLVVISILSSVVNVFGQLPVTTLYRLLIENPNDSIWNITKVDYLSGFNQKGYNNQPYLLNQNEFLATIRLQKSNNTDIYKFNFISNSYVNLTKSNSSEYSPRISITNPESFNCIWVPEQDSTIQDLVEIDLKKGLINKFIFKEEAKIGYFRPFMDKNWICFLVQEPPILTLYNEQNKTRKIIASTIGRSFEVLNKREIYFVHKITDENWLLKSYNILTEKIKTIAVMPKSCEDFIFTENQKVLCASDSKILRLDQNNSWQTVTDLKPLKISKINRLALKNNILILVSSPYQ